MDTIAKEILSKNNIHVDEKVGLSENELADIINEYDALIVRSATKVTKKIIISGKNLKVIGRAGAGVDNIDINEAKKNNILVMNTPGGNSVATAEHTLALLLSLLRKIPYSNNTTHQGKWEKKSIKGRELSGKTVGIIGFGNVAVKFYELIKGFNTNVLLCSKSFEDRKKDFPEIQNTTFEEILLNSDIITFHCKSPSNNKPLITINEIKKMKPNAVLINTARGNIINENDLNQSLNDNLISGAAIDVFSNEPAKDNILFNNPKVILTPHIAASTYEAQIKVAEMISNQISDYLLENKIINTVE